MIPSLSFVYSFHSVRIEKNKPAGSTNRPGTIRLLCVIHEVSECFFDGCRHLQSDFSHFPVTLISDFSPKNQENSLCSFLPPFGESENLVVIETTRFSPCDLRCCGGDKRDRTADLLNAIQALSRMMRSRTPVNRSFGWAFLCKWRRKAAFAHSTYKCSECTMVAHNTKEVVL